MTTHQPPVGTARSRRFGVATPGYRPSPAPDGGPGPVPPKRRRRRRLLGVLAVVVVAGGLYGAFRGGRATSPAPPVPPVPPALTAEAATVVALPAGTVLRAADMRAVTVTVASRPAALSSAQAMALVGERVTQALPAGTLLTAGDLTTRPFPGRGQAVVGLQLTAADSPAGGLAAGETVGVIYVADASQPPYPRPVPLATATVWSVGTDTDGTSVDLLVSTGLATTLSADASHSELTLVALNPGTTWPTR